MTSGTKRNSTLTHRLSSLSEKKQTAVYFLLYTLCFAFIVLAVFSKYIISGKTLVWNLDGMTQHYPVYIYLGEWLREIFRNIFVEHTFSVPVWDINIGAGSDIITTFNYYGLGDPLCLLTVFFNKSNAYYIYDALIILRLYLSGVFFSCFCFRMKQKGVGAFLGTFTYVFCGYSLFSSVRHPFFILPMVFLPLMLLGAERILSGESPVLFIITVFMSLTINFYFAYMVILLTVIYVAVRFFTQKEAKKLKPFFSLLGKFLLYGITGVLMSLVLLLPVLLVFLSSSRTELSHDLPLTYDLLYYLRVYSGFCGYMNAGSWTVTGFAPLTLISALVLFRRKGNTYLKVLVVLETLFLLVPVVGKLLNGFSYIANRWVWGYALLLSFTTAVMFPYLCKLSKKDKTFLAFTTGSYIITAFVIQQYVLGKINLSVLAQLLVLFASVAVILLTGFIFKKQSKRVTAFLLAVLCFVSLGANAYYVHYSQSIDYISEFVSKKDAVALIENSVSNKVYSEEQDGFYRYEQVPNRKVRNQSVVDNSHGVSFYWSLTNDNVSNYLHESEAVTFASHDFLNFDRKTFINELFSVKYFFAPSKDTPAPYGYEYSRTLSTHQGDYDVYVNKYALPLGYTYSDYITREEYDSLTASEKQEALMSNILLETEPTGFDKNTYKLTGKKLDSVFECGEGVTIENNRFIVTKNNAKVNVNFASVENCELYLDFVGLHCEDELWTSDIKKMNGEWDSQDSDYKFKVMKRELLSRDAKKYIIEASTEDLTFSFNLSTPDYQGYDNAHNFLANLGYNEKTVSSAAITFKDAGIYSFERIDVIAQPMENYTECAQERAENTLQDVQIVNNGFEGNISLSEPQLLFVSVPYSEGFTAYVDGKETEILRANTFGMALSLSEGEHHIEFRYHTHGLGLGAVMSLTGFAVFTVIAVTNRKKKK